MSKTLLAEGQLPSLVAPTTTSKLAQRLLCTSRTVTRRLPRGVGSSPAIDYLLTLYVAEDDGHCLSVGDVASSTDQSAAVTERWLSYLGQVGFVERRGDMLALSAAGHAAVTDVTEAVFAAQRALD